MAGVLATQQPALFVEPLQHVAVAHGCALEGDALAPERLLQAEVGHQRADHAPREAAATAVVHRDHVEQLVAVVGAAVAVDHQQPVAVAVERDAEVRVVRDHRFLRWLGCVAPTPSLMFNPFGSAPTEMTSAPSSWNTGGATL